MKTTQADNIFVGTPDQIAVEMDKQVGGKVLAFHRLEFGKHRGQIAALSLQDKMAWYAMQNPQEIISLGNNPEFQRFWKWRVLLPIKLKRFYFRAKNGQLFKHHAHITEMREKVKPHSI